MAKFIKSKFRVLWGTVFSFFAGMFTTDIAAEEAEEKANDESVSSVEKVEEEEALDPGAIAAAVAAAIAILSGGSDNAVIP